MKHSDWLRLQTEGDRICATMRQQGYKCHKQTRRLSWKLCSLDQDDYILTFAPTPISDWTLIPNNTNPERQQLWQLIERTLTNIRREVLKTPQERNSQIEDYSRPWAIIRHLPNARRYTVARFFNRQDQKIIDAFSTASSLRLNLKSSLMFLTNNCNKQLTNKKIKLLAQMLDPSPALFSLSSPVPTLAKRHEVRKGEKESKPLSL